MTGENTRRTETGGESIDWIVIAKGIGIILVVVGHFFPANSPPYWSAMRKIIYTFHMPLFFLLSGYLYVNGKYPYAELIKNKVHRLLYPFVTLAVSYLIVKYVAALFIPVEFPVNTRSVIALLTDPVESYLPLLWFIHALFLIFVFYPVARFASSDLSIVLVCLTIEEVFGNKFPIVGKALVYLPFFAVGILYRKNREAAGAHEVAGADVRAAATFVAAAVIFALGSVLELEGREDFDLGYTFQCLVGVMGSLVVIGCSRFIARAGGGRSRSLLLNIGRYSMTIYLFHPLFESAVRVLFGRWQYTDVPFGVIAGVAIGAGVWAPMCIERYLFRRFLVTRRYVLGMA